MAVPSVHGLPAPLSVMYNDDMWSVYVLKHSVTSRLYIDRTDNMTERLQTNNGGSQEATRRRSGRWTLVYREQYRDKRDAVLRERRLKHHGSAKRELYKRIQFSLGD